jgi:type IV pilus assembly protein PilQ
MVNARGWAWLMMWLSLSAWGASSKLEHVDVVAQPNGETAVLFRIDGTVPEPRLEFRHLPPRLTVTLPGVKATDSKSVFDGAPLRAIRQKDLRAGAQLDFDLTTAVAYEARRDQHGLMLLFHRDAVMPAVASAATAPLGQNVVLTDLEYGPRAAGGMEVRLVFSGPAPLPQSFELQSPPRLVLDLPNTNNALQHPVVKAATGLIRSIDTAQTGGQTRVVITLASTMPHAISRQQNSLAILLTPPTVAPVKGMLGMEAALGAIQGIDFRRGATGAGRLLVTLSNPSVPVNVVKEGSDIVVRLSKTELPEQFRRRYDVVDFSTPVTAVTARDEGQDAVLRLATNGPFEQMTYQTGTQLTVEVRPLTPVEEQARRTKQYTGQKISFNFQNVSIRAVLQLLAEFARMNLVVSESVNGNVALRLDSVPWDEALDIVLRSQGLDKRIEGNILYVAPSSEMAAQEQSRFEAQQRIEQSAPLVTEYIQINYAKAADIAKLIFSEEHGNSLLSDRGRLSVDERTNQLVVRDTQDRIADIRATVDKLDIPVRQVLIEARLVDATDRFARDLGARFGVNRWHNTSYPYWNAGGSLESADPTTVPWDPSRLGFNSPAAPTTPTGQTGSTRTSVTPGTFGTIILGRDYLVAMELTALQQEGTIDVLSSPFVLTADQQEATIRRGAKIPYQENAGFGTTNIQYIDAVLELKVTPQITPDGRINMLLDIKNDTPGAPIPTGGGGQSIQVDTQEVISNVLVNDGETVVLGGIFTDRQTRNATKVPWLGDIPLLGILFRSNAREDEKRELLIFVTPRIVHQANAPGV